MTDRARALDQFYTDPLIARSLVQALPSKTAPSLWVEPSAGAGAFLQAMPPPRIGLDLDPAHAEVVHADFLQWAPPQVDGPIWVVGNPPFGRVSRLAIRFFNHAAEFADRIAFVVPKTFEKHSVQARLSGWFSLTQTQPMPDQAFWFQGTPYHVPCIFQVWDRKTTQRVPVHFTRTHEDFAFVQAAEADFSFQRVGAQAGKTSVSFAHKSRQSHYFIKDHTSQQRVRTVLDHVDWTDIKQRNAGNPSIGKAELVAAYTAQTLRQ